MSRQLRLVFDDEVAKKLDTLKARTGLKTDGEVIARSLDIASVVTMHVSSGGKVLLTHPTMDPQEFELEPRREHQGELGEDQDSE